MAAGVIAEDRAWLERLDGELRRELAPVFAQAGSRLTAFPYIGALLAEPGDRKSCWQLAERAGHATPRRMQALLAEYVWDWKAVLAALQRFIVAQLGDPEAIVVLDETAELKKGTATAGVARHAGITGQVENCQTVVFAAYATASAHVLSDFRLYLRSGGARTRGRETGRDATALGRVEAVQAGVTDSTVDMAIEYERQLVPKAIDRGLPRSDIDHLSHAFYALLDENRRYGFEAAGM